MSADEKTDQELARDCLSGNRAAFEELVRRHQDAVFGLAVGMTRNREDAADMAQEAFVKAYMKLGQYNPEYAFKSWILRICANQTKNLFRKRTRRREAEEGRLRHEAIHADGAEEGYDALESALAALPPKFAVPLRLKHLEGLSYEEVSAILGLGMSAVKMRVSRGKSRLAEMLKDEKRR